MSVVSNFSDSMSSVSEAGVSSARNRRVHTAKRKWTSNACFRLRILSSIYMYKSPVYLCSDTMVTINSYLSVSEHVTFIIGKCLLLLLLLWHAPRGVCSTKCRHQSPEWMILSHVNCFIQGEVIGFQVLLDSLHPRSTYECVLVVSSVLRRGNC